MGRRKHIPFRAGETRPVANVEILKITFLSPTAETTMYLVRQLCCGTEISISHADIRRRETASRDYRGLRCKQCSSVGEPLTRGVPNVMGGATWEVPNLGASLSFMNDTRPR